MEQDTIVLILLHILVTFFIVLIPLLFEKMPPKDINMIYGYRTKRSMKNLDTWKVANSFSAKLLRGLTVILVTIQLPLFFICSPPMSLLWTSIAWVIGLFMVIYRTEQYLKKTFDQEGNRSVSYTHLTLPTKRIV